MVIILKYLPTILIFHTVFLCLYFLLSVRFYMMNTADSSQNCFCIRLSKYCIWWTQLIPHRIAFALGYQYHRLLKTFINFFSSLQISIHKDASTGIFLIKWCWSPIFYKGNIKKRQIKQTKIYTNKKSDVLINHP